MVKRIANILRIAVLAVLSALVIVPSVLYILLSTPWASEKMRGIAEEQLTALLGTDVSVRHVSVEPFDRIEVEGVSVDDDYGKRALSVGTLTARLDVMDLLHSRTLSIGAVTLDSLHVRLYRNAPGQPLNIDGIIKRLNKPKPDQGPTHFKLAVQTVIIGASSVTYDVYGTPVKKGRFDANHLAVSNLNLMASLPIVSDSLVQVRVQRLGATEHSGLTLSNASFYCQYTPRSLRVEDLAVEMPGTRIALGNLAFSYDKPAQLAALGRTTPVHAVVTEGSYATPSDFAAFVPQLKSITHRVYVHADAAGTLSNFNVNALEVSIPRIGFSTNVQGTVKGGFKPANMELGNVKADVNIQPGTYAEFAHLIPERTRAVLDRIVPQLGNIKLDVAANGALSGPAVKLNLHTAQGGITAEAVLANLLDARNLSVDGRVEAVNLNLGLVPGMTDWQTVTATVEGNAALAAGKVREAVVDARIARALFRKTQFENVDLSATLNPQGAFTASLIYDNPASAADIAASGNILAPNYSLNLQGKVRNVDLAAYGVAAKYAGYRLGAKIDADLEGSSPDDMRGSVTVSNLSFVYSGEPDAQHPSLHVARACVDVDTRSVPNTLTVSSDVLNGGIQGTIVPTKLVAECRDIVSRVLPALAPYQPVAQHAETNKFNFAFEITDTEAVSQFIKMPVDIVHPVSLNGHLDYNASTLTATVDAPYLQQGEKIIENTAAHVDINGNADHAEVYVTSSVPTQKGQLNLAARITGASNRLDTRVDWEIERQVPINGILSLSTLLARDVASNKLTADIAFNPSDITFGNDVWSIGQSHIGVQPGRISVDGLSLSSGEQSIKVDGIASADPGANIRVDLRNVQLLPIFETLDVGKVMIGGRATGTFQGRQVLSDRPAIWCNRLDVPGIAYNRCTLGDAIVRAHWDNRRKAFHLNADVVEPGGEKSRIYGDIFVPDQALDINFDAHRIKVGFLKPFMSAWAQDVTGYASGKARLFGTFKHIDLEGDLYADSLGIKVDYTNTWYYANDSVRIRPGRIMLDNITLRDRYGNTGRLNGYVKHNYFLDADFEFRITDTDGLLVYDVPSSKSPDWYGTIFGNGSALVSGYPGKVNIDVNMRTTEGSTFTFVLSDNKVAEDYTFMQFRNRQPVVVQDSIIEVFRLPKAVAAYRDRQKAAAAKADTPTEYSMSFAVDVTPAAKVTLIMDPVGGDQIKAWGNGSLRMTYAAPGNELHMYGNYTIDKGSYNFTLQDIIVKDFKINEGSSISFTGDPYAANLDIKAMYTLNANLSDLDESFLHDKDLNRTTVPVNAVLMATGDMRQPETRFDLDFPTLNSDIYRKVRSIISTDEMMSRQIIYLLALSRFYTPEYMATTKGNELFSVASSTISSQLGNMLGKLSENWSISPNLRSDRGDFSDVEVDVALSSSLLNNRLLFNGNFGYRDKSLNTNQFVGDFDLEYLLNRRGNWRLKAYNRYNDQNYYLRTAQTTQGVALQFKCDFDNLFRRRTPADTLPHKLPRSKKLGLQNPVSMERVCQNGNDGQ